MKGVQYVCIENVGLKVGTANQLIRRAEMGMLPIYRIQPGFAAFVVAKLGEASVLSFSVWHSQEQAEKAARTWETWVKEHAAHLVESTQPHIGELGFFVSPGELVPQLDGALVRPKRTAATGASVTGQHDHALPDSVLPVIVQGGAPNRRIAQGGAPNRTGDHLPK